MDIENGKEILIVSRLVIYLLSRIMLTFQLKVQESVLILMSMLNLKI